MPAAVWLRRAGMVALPGDTGTDNLVDAAVLGAMKRTAVLINVGRGNAVDEARLRARSPYAAGFIDPSPITFTGRCSP